MQLLNTLYVTTPDVYLHLGNDKAWPEDPVSGSVLLRRAQYGRAALTAEADGGVLDDQDFRGLVHVAHSPVTAGRSMARTALPRPASAVSELPDIGVDSAGSCFEPNDPAKH